MNKDNLIELDKILREHKRDDMGVPFAHGAIVALLSASVKTTPQQMIAALVENAKAIPRLEPLFSECYREVAKQLEDCSYLPLLSIEKKISEYTYEDAKSWCMGYLAGLYNYKSAEEITREPRLTDLLFPFTVLADPVNFMKDASRGEEGLNRSKQLELLEQTLEMLPSAIYAIIEYHSSGGKVGRNDPCPCGSGKKYKKCCGR